MTSFTIDLGFLTLSAAQLAIVGVALLAFFLHQLLTRRLRKELSGSGTERLRPLPPFELLKRQIGQAVESGSQVHVGLGRGGLAGRRSMGSVAGLQVLDSLAEESCANDTPPIITVGEGTLLPAAQDTIYRAYAQAGRLRDFVPDTARFMADAGQPLVYAAGAADAISSEEVTSNILMGYFGAEMALLTEAASRRRTEQIVGSDDPTALAIGAATTENLLVGEEFLAAGAYLEREPGQIAALRTQDVLRVLLALGIVGYALYQLLL
jgi:hypothetical protein